MSTQRFIRPSRVPIREAWPREDQDFTPWLAANLDYLADCGIGELELVDQEVPIPGIGRALDILARRLNGELVAIENQYREIDHDHLTRGLAYAVGHDASALVVIAEAHRSEFIAVANYLNRAAEHAGNDGIAVWLLGIRVEQVGEYLIPRFEVVAQPNEWLAQVQRQATDATSADAVRQAGRGKFWDEFLAEVRAQQLPIFQGWNYQNAPSIFTAAIPGTNIAWMVRVRENEAIVELMVDVGDALQNEQLFRSIERSAAQLEAELGGLTWDVKEGARRCSISMSPIADCGWRVATDVRAAQITDLVEQLARFHSAMRPVLLASWKSLRADTDEHEVEED